MITENQRLRELRDGLAIKYSEIEQKHNELIRTTINGLGVIQTDLMDLTESEEFEGNPELELLKIIDKIQNIKDTVRN